MWYKGGKWVWVNPFTGATYTEELHDMTESKITAANARAATALGITESQMELKNHGRQSHTKKGKK